MEHAAQAPEWAAALEASWIGVTMRQSALAYPLVNILHLLGLVLLAGPILLLDLRLLGLGRARISADAASAALTPFALAGLGLFVLTGPLMFAADARALASSEMMIWKLALIGCALVNAALFRIAWGRRLADWDAAPPLLGRAQALASVAAWLSAAALGRMIAYL